MDTVAVPRCEGELFGGVRHGHVAHHLGELAVEQHVGQVLAQRVAGLAAHLVDAVDESAQTSVLADPFRGGLLADAGDAGQVVARVAAQRREVRILLGGEPVLLLHRLGGEARQVGDAAPRIQHRDVAVDELERVAVAGHHEHPEALGVRLRRERGDDVVGLVASIAITGIPIAPRTSLVRSI